MEESNPFQSFSFIENPEALTFDEESVGQNDRLSKTERSFLLKVVRLTKEDPTLPRFVFEARTKLAGGQKLTNDEADSLLRKLNCRDFPEVQLDLSEMKFPQLIMAYGIVGHLVMQGTEIEGDLVHTGMIIDNLDQIDMKVGGNLNQAGLRTGSNTFKGTCFQIGMSVDGICDQTNMEIGDNLIQSRMHIGRGLWQENLKTRLSLYQDSVVIGGECIQREAAIGGHAIHDDMKVRRDFDETRKTVGVRVQNAMYSTKNLQVGGEHKTEGLDVQGERRE